MAYVAGCGGWGEGAGWTDDGWTGLCWGGGAITRNLLSRDPEYNAFKDGDPFRFSNPGSFVPAMSVVFPVTEPASKWSL